MLMYALQNVPKDTLARSWVGTSCFFWRPVMKKYFDENDIRFFKILALTTLLAVSFTWVLL